MFAIALIVFTSVLPASFVSSFVFLSIGICVRTVVQIISTLTMLSTGAQLHTYRSLSSCHHPHLQI